MGSDFVDVLGLSDFGAAPLSSLPELELELLPVLDFPQSQESDVELSSSLSVSSQPDDEELEDEELDDEELEELEDEELVDEELDDEELEELVELEPQLSPLVSLLEVSSVPVDEVLPHPSSATGASSPVSS